MTSDTDYWACRVCRSINARRSNRCYSCHTPREAAAVNPMDLPTTGQAPPVVHTGTYRSTEARAVLVTLATAIFILGSLAATFMLWQVAELRSAGERGQSDDLFESLTPLFVLVPILGIAALVSYAAWISRVVENLPALGLGYSRVSPTMAFLEPLIPGFNLYALPARVGEVIRKLDEKGPGLPLLGLSFILVIGAPIAAGVLIRVSREFETTGDFLRTSGFTLFLAFAVQAVGLGIALYLVWLVERLARTRAEQPPSAQQPAEQRPAR
jgi:hypothetical protein